MSRVLRFLGAFLSSFVLVVLGDLGTAYAVDCEATPEDPACVEPSPTPTPTEEPEPTPTVTVAVTETVTPTPVPVATATATYGPFAATGVVVDPATGEVSVSEDAGVGLGVGLWVASILAGVVTATKVLP